MDDDKKSLNQLICSLLFVVRFVVMCCVQVYQTAAHKLCKANLIITFTQNVFDYKGVDSNYLEFF